MATPTYTPIASITLGSDVAEVEFSSIPQDYRDLVLVANYTAASASFSGKAYANNDFNTGNYTGVRMTGTGSSANSNSVGASIRWDVQSTGLSLAILQFLNYSATDKHKNVLVRANNDAGTQAGVTRWSNTSGITIITIQFGTNLNAGSTFALYGIEA